jgi:hypothetical protein
MLRLCQQKMQNITLDHSLSFFYKATLPHSVFSGSTTKAVCGKMLLSGQFNNLLIESSYESNAEDIKIDFFARNHEKR